jgi:hypothetical protein
VIFAALAERRVHLSAAVLLAPHLTPENVQELLSAATHRTRAEVEQLLALRFPKPDLPARVEPIVLAPIPAPAPELPSSETIESDAAQLSPGTVGASACISEPAPAQIESPAPRPRITPLAPERFAVQFTFGRRAHDKLRKMQALLSHRVPSGDISEIFELSLDALQEQVEKQKFAATEKPQRQRPRRSTSNPRTIPAHVKRAVWERDQGRCTFVSESGKRCEARKFLEFDHVQELARGGTATVRGIRLLCNAHNQYAAEQTFGAGFMEHKREEAQQAAARHTKVTANELKPSRDSAGWFGQAR